MRIILIISLLFFPAHPLLADSEVHSQLEFFLNEKLAVIQEKEKAVKTLLAEIDGETIELNNKATLSLVTLGFLGTYLATSRYPNLYITAGAGVILLGLIADSGSSNHQIIVKKEELELLQQEIQKEREAIENLVRLSRLP